MKTMVFICFIFFTSLTITLSCEQDKTSLSGNNIVKSNNFIKNQSFETEGQPSLKFWYVESRSGIYFSNDTPPGGGNWSIYMHAKLFAPLPESPSYYVPVSPGKYIFDFPVYGKSKTIPGAAMLVLKRNDHREIVAKHLITDSLWTKYELIDTLIIRNGDSLSVLLFGGGTRVVDGITYFDLVELRTIE